MHGTRNGWITYAAAMLFIAAGLHAMWALWAGAAWVGDVSNGILGGQRWLWGLVDAVLAVVLVFGGRSLMRGDSFGRWVAVIGASLACFRWFYWMPFAPFLALTLLVMMFLVLYGTLVTWGEER